MPAEDVRAAVSGIADTDVKHLVVTLLLRERIIADRASVALLMSGLKNASYPEPMPQNRVDSVLIVLKDGRRIGPFAFSTDRCVDAFSPGFCEGLRREGIAVPSR